MQEDHGLLTKYYNTHKSLGKTSCKEFYAYNFWFPDIFFKVKPWLGPRDFLCSNAFYYQ